MKRVIKAEERTLWQEATRSVRRSKIDPAPALQGNAPPIAEPVKSKATSTPKINKAKTALPAEIPRALDGETASRLKRKLARPQAKLDLHGLTEAAAHAALIDFIHKSLIRNHSLVLVITGKGRLSGGVLRRNLPLWLEAPNLRPSILAIAPAFTPDGGDGAYYVQLRKRT